MIGRLYQIVGSVNWCQPHFRIPTSQKDTQSAQVDSGTPVAGGYAAIVKLLQFNLLLTGLAERQIEQRRKGVKIPI
ncbi:MAG: hypothetical protein WAO07_15000 [Desulfobacterales bacterium]